MVLKLPEIGVSRSIKQHNCNSTIVSDWVEASTLVGGASTTKADILRVLIDESVYDKQDFASEFVDDIWRGLRERRRRLNRSVPYEVEDRSTRPTGTWEDAPAAAFMLIMSIAPAYADIRASLNGQYVAQGHHFERIVYAALCARGWAAYSTGWQSGMQMAAFVDLVQGVASFMGERQTNLSVANDLVDANDGGVDLVCVDDYGDARAATPALFVQCASGADWKDKFSTPNVETWGDLVQFLVKPMRGMAVPFLLDEQAFNKHVRQFKGVFLDRCRLLHGLDSDARWLPAADRAALLDWLRPHVAVVSALV